MSNYVAVNGITFDDADVDRWADDAESGFKKSTLTRETLPWLKTEPMQARSIRVPASLWATLERQAAEAHVTPSEYARVVLARGLVAAS